MPMDVVKHSEIAAGTEERQLPPDVVGFIDPRPPPQTAEQYGQMIAELMCALQPHQNGEPLEAAHHALRALVRFIDHDPVAMSEGLTTPLFGLINAIQETLQGGKPDLFRSPDQFANKRGRRTDLPIHALRGNIANMVEALCDVGLSTAEAGKMIEDEAHKAGIKKEKGASILSRDALDWKYEVGRNAPGLVTEMAKEFKNNRRGPATWADAQNWTRRQMQQAKRAAF